MSYFTFLVMIILSLDMNPARSITTLRMKRRREDKEDKRTKQEECEEKNSAKGGRKCGSKRRNKRKI